MSGVDRVGALCIAAALVMAAGLEGGVEVQYGAAAVGVATVGALVVLRAGIPRPSLLARFGLLAVALPLIFQLLPIPAALRRIVAPGQAAWFDRMSAEPGDLHAWLDQWTGRDFDAALGAPSPIPDLTAGAKATGWATAAVDPTLLPWQLALLGACALVFLAGRRIGHHEQLTRHLAVGLILLCIVETILGLMWRDGPTTGLSEKVAHLGSATGTFKNRGHFAALLVLGIGAGWGIAGGLFPLEPEEVRRHRARKRRSSQPPTLFEAAGDKIPRLALLAFVVGLLSLGLVAANSRGALVSLAVAGAILGVWTWRRRQERTHLGIALAVPVAGVILAVIALGPRGAIGRFAALGSADVSVTTRLSMWGEGLRALRDAPIFGAGLGAWRHVWPMFEVAPHLYTSAYAHQEYLQWAVELGAVGFVGLVSLLLAYARRFQAELDLADSRPDTAMAIGLSVGVLAVLFQAFADFPLHIPGVALPTALVAGLALGSAAASREPAPAAPRRGGVIVGGALVLALAVGAWVEDRGTPGSRGERLGGIPALVYATDVRTVGEAEAFRERAVAEAARVPLDPWRHAAVAKAESLLVGAGEGGEPEARAYAAEVALARAYALRPKDPRLLVYLADVRLRISRTLSIRDVFRADALTMLVAAVHLDAWRAESAFAVSDELNDEAIAQIAAAAPDDPLARARVGYHHGRTLVQRGKKEAALAALVTAAEAHPGFGPPAFEAGVTLVALGRPDEARVWFERFFTTKDRPAGMEAWASYHLGRLEAAEMMFRRLVEQNPKNGWALEGLAKVARARKDVRTERMALERLLTLTPDNKDLRARIQRIDAGDADAPTSDAPVRGGSLPSLHP